ncbi:AAA family ATPase [Candidatus Symbiothrix dinenymphae]|uniref:cytidylate kinase-like family protein n=1 Tax=Candidatus Symbiothrix dinenymphae TaxID=467085 RepID=UPI0006C3FB39|nr:cytidylate kinase-like family protein [Candidatus Symbiothrix dinenymphae]GAP71443.1 cytidylate kinase [Candidatus Symbiothrix dinenymphae]
MSYIITIGRQLGSGGKMIGGLLSERLGIPCYEKELIELAAAESGLGKEFFEKIDEKGSHSFLGNLFGFRSGFMGDNSGNYLSNEMLFKIQSDVIRKLAEKSGIFVGRCADYILRDHPQCLKIFITANTEDRINRISHDQGISKEKAEALIEEIDRKRAAYYNYFSNKTWGMAASYDLCINSSVFSEEDVIGIIIKQVEVRATASKL